MNSTTISAIAELITAITWPSLVLLVMLLHREAFNRILNNLEEFALPGGIEGKLRKAVNREAEAVIQQNPDAAKGITQEQARAAERIDRLAVKGDNDLARQQMQSLAFEYEAIRASMPSSDERTRKMEKIVTKMRTLAVACYPYIMEFSGSDSPGQRLAAVAILQLKPNPEFYPWLADRLKVETPFVGYHAAVALLSAVRLSRKQDWDLLRETLSTAETHLSQVSHDSDRYNLIKGAQAELERQKV
ncbi:hypothetical protein GC163_20870 [bacterium]|nr:hypothetical protein [bacterium]